MGNLKLQGQMVHGDRKIQMLFNLKFECSVCVCVKYTWAGKNQVKDRLLQEVVGGLGRGGGRPHSVCRYILLWRLMFESSIAFDATQY